jgi:hypothetical protein
VEVVVYSKGVVVHSKGVVEGEAEAHWEEVVVVVVVVVVVGKF